MMGQCDLVCGYVGVSDNCGSVWLGVAQIVMNCIDLRGSSDPALKGRERGVGSQEGWPVR